MRTLDFKNNALFLACYHERNRPVLIFCLVGLIAAVFILAYLSFTVEKALMKDLLEGMFWVVLVMQSVLVTVVGSLFVWHMGAREKSSGTLDFHRSSPEPVARKIIGLMLGSTWLEWIIFGVLGVAGLVLVVFLNYRVEQVILFNISVALTAVFLHITSAFFSLLSSGKQRHSLLVVFFLMWFAGPLFFMMSQMSALFVHLFGITAYRFLIPDAFKEINNVFFVFQLPDLALQVMVQLPLAVLFVAGIKRIFCQPNSPVLSKPNVLRLCVFCLFLMVGFFIASFVSLGEHLLNSVGQYDYRYYSLYYTKDAVNAFIGQGIAVYLGLFSVLGLVVACAGAPTYFQYMKRIVLMNREGAQKQGLFSDGASSLLPVAIYAALGALLFGFYIQAIGIPWTRGIGVFTWTTAYILGFSGFLEYFRLSRFRYNKIFFLSVLAGWWIFVPWAVAVLRNFNFYRTLSFAAISPFLGIGRAYWLVLPENARFGLDMVECVTPWLAVAVVWIWSGLQRSQVREQVEDKLENQKADKK